MAPVPGRPVSRRLHGGEFIEAGRRRRPGLRPQVSPPPRRRVHRGALAPASAPAFASSRRLHGGEFIEASRSLMPRSTAAVSPPPRRRVHRGGYGGRGGALAFDVSPPPRRRVHRGPNHRGERRSAADRSRRLHGGEFIEARSRRCSRSDSRGVSPPPRRRVHRGLHRSRPPPMSRMSRRLHGGEFIDAVKRCQGCAWPARGLAASAAASSSTRPGAGLDVNVRRSRRLRGGEFIEAPNTVRCSWAQRRWSRRLRGGEFIEATTPGSPPGSAGVSPPPRRRVHRGALQVHAIKIAEWRSRRLRGGEFIEARRACVPRRTSGACLAASAAASSSRLAMDHGAAARHWRSRRLRGGEFIEACRMTTCSPTKTRSSCLAASAAASSSRRGPALFGVALEHLSRRLRGGEFIEAQPHRFVVDLLQSRRLRGGEFIEALKRRGKRPS